MTGDNRDMLQVNEDKYKKMNANQVETMLYGARILAKINKRKRKSMLDKNKRIEFGKDQSGDGIGQYTIDASLRR